jgi:hypothetical protein
MAIIKSNSICYQLLALIVSTEIFLASAFFVSKQNSQFDSVDFTIYPKHDSMFARETCTISYIEIQEERNKNKSKATDYFEYQTGLVITYERLTSNAIFLSRIILFYQLHILYLNLRN